MARLTEAQEQARLTWRWRAINATRGQQSKLGTILLAVIKTPGKNPPWFGPSAVVDTAGNVLANFVDRSNGMHEAVFVGSLADLVDNWRRLADTIDATQEEREEMFEQLRFWIVADYRAQAQSAQTLH